MLLRLYRSKDLDGVLDLFYRTVHGCCARDYTQAQLDAWAPQNPDRSRWQKTLTQHYSLVVEGEGGLAAFGDLDGSYLDRLYVHPDCRGQGLAALLVDALEARALQGGVKVLRTDASITALPFFLARGYRVVREQQVKRGEQTLTNYALEREL